MKLLKFLFIALFGVLLFSCSNDDSTRMIVRLTDSPGDYEKINIDIVGVQVHREGGNQESGWMELDANASIYDLLELTDGVETVIANSMVPPGKISQVRLVLGDNNSVLVDGTEHALTTPSAHQSGLKLQVHETLTEGITYSLLLDFDGAKSVVKTGADKYILKPVIRTIAEAQDGAISGTVIPAIENVAVYAMVGEDIMGTSYAVEDNADFFIGGLDEGTYTLVFDPGELSDYDVQIIEGVKVVIGEITDHGETTLQLK